MANDIFNRKKLTIKTPFTADACGISVDGTPAAHAVQVQCSYSQQVQRRRSIGNQDAIIYGSQPVGQITINRLVVEDAYGILGGKTFQGCGQDGVVTLHLASNCGSGSKDFRCEGCIASQFSISIEAEGLTVMDNIVIEFLQMSEG